MGTPGPEPATAELFLFGPFALDSFARTLRSHDLAVPLEPSTFELLEFFVRNAGRFVSTDEILDAAWPGEDADTYGVAQQMLLLRGTLARHSPRDTFLVSEPNGYRFVARVESRVATATPGNPEAQRLTERGRYFYEKRTADALHRSIHYFRQAIALDPRFVPALAGLASAYAVSGEYMVLPPTQAFPHAADAAHRALSVDDASAEAHVVLVQVAARFDLDYAVAERHLARALELAPKAPGTAVFAAWFLCVTGRAAEAADVLRAALAGEPYSLILRTSVAITSLFRRAFPEAIEQLRAVLDMDPDYVHARFYLAIATQLAGRDEEALALSAFTAPDGYEQQFLALRGSALGRLGRVDEARAAGDAMRALASRGRYVSYFNLAWLAVGLGDDEHAIRLLEAGFEQRDPWTVFVPEYPLFDALRGQPAFEALAERVRRGGQRPA